MKVLSLVFLFTALVLAAPAEEAPKDAVLEKRYCINCVTYCAGGSAYINCGSSYVRPQICSSTDKLT
jgi:hypothetical protein